MNLSPQSPMLMIGCGHMGRALVEGWCASAVNPTHLIIVDRHPDRLAPLQTRLDFTVYASLDELPDEISPAIICLAVKPAALEALLPIVASRFADTSPLILTVIAGKPLSYYESQLWSDAAVIRLMPNTPAQIQKAMTGCIENDHVHNDQRHWADALMKEVGQTIWLDDEDQMHALTALSGSGPAYVFYLIECFIEEAVHQGFSAEQAQQLVTQTFLGASQMAIAPTADISQLRKAVTSPGGTTEAGLEQWMQHRLANLIHQTIDAAKTRSSELF